MVKSVGWLRERERARELSSAFLYCVCVWQSKQRQRNGRRGDEKQHIHNSGFLFQTNRPHAPRLPDQTSRHAFSHSHSHSPPTMPLEGQVYETVSSSIRAIPDFPKKGILFQDVTTLLLDPVVRGCGVGRGGEGERGVGGRELVRTVDGWCTGQPTHHHPTLHRPSATASTTLSPATPAPASTSSPASKRAASFSAPPRPRPRRALCPPAQTRQTARRGGACRL